MRTKASTLQYCFILFVATLMWLAACVNTQRKEAQPEPPTTGIVMAIQRPLTLGVVVDKGMRIIALDRGGAAEAAGLQVGDQLVSLNGLAFSTRSDAIKRVLLDPNSLDGGLADDTITVMDGSAKAESQAQPVPAQVVGQPDLPVATAAITPLRRVAPSVVVVIQRKEQVQSLNLDLSIYPRYDVLPTPTAMPSGSELLYF